MRALIGALVLSISAPVFADTPSDPMPPVPMPAHQPFTPTVPGAFISDSYATAKLHAFQRVCRERDEMKKALLEKEDHTKPILITASLGFTAGVVVTLLLIGMSK